MFTSHSVVRRANEETSTEGTSQANHRELLPRKTSLQSALACNQFVGLH
jgi:hypothetical protein